MNQSPRRASTRLKIWLSGVILAMVASALMAQVPSRAPNFGSVADTRHNMTQSYRSGA